MITRTRRGYSGFTLIEILVVTTLTAFILGSVGIVLSSLHRINNKLREEIPADAQLARLGLQFRTDAHAAHQIELLNENQLITGLRMTTAENTTIEYRSHQNRIARQVNRGDQVERREECHLRRDSEVDWSLNSNSTLASVSIRRHWGRTPGSDDDLRVTTVTAAVGLNQPATHR